MYVLPVSIRQNCNDQLSLLPSFILLLVLLACCLFLYSKKLRNSCSCLGNNNVMLGSEDIYL